MQAHRKTTIWLGLDDGDAPGADELRLDIHSEDDMVAVEMPLQGSSEWLEVFIQPQLFGRIREVMDAIEKRR